MATITPDQFYTEFVVTVPALLQSVFTVVSGPLSLHPAGLASIRSLIVDNTNVDKRLVSLQDTLLLGMSD